MLAKFDLPGGSAFLRQLLHWHKIGADEHEDNPRQNYWFTKFSQGNSYSINDGIFASQALSKALEYSLRLDWWSSTADVDLSLN